MNRNASPGASRPSTPFGRIGNLLRRFHAKVTELDCGVFLRIVLDFLGNSLSFNCRTLRFPRNRTRAFHLVVARCAGSSSWKSMKCFLSLASVQCMEWTFYWNLGFYSTPALPRSVCCPVVALQQNPGSSAQVTPSRRPRPPHLTNFYVMLCIFSALFYAGISRAPPASVGSLFSA